MDISRRASVLLLVYIWSVQIEGVLYSENNTTKNPPTSTFPSHIRPPPGASLPPGEATSDWEKYGLPIVLLVAVIVVFAIVHWAVFILPETHFWKRWTNYEQLQEEENSNMGYTMKRKNSLRRKLQKYRDKSRKRGQDGNGGSGSNTYYDLPPATGSHNAPAIQPIEGYISGASIEENGTHHDGATQDYFPDRGRYGNTHDNAGFVIEEGVRRERFNYEENAGRGYARYEEEEEGKRRGGVSRGGQVSHVVSFDGSSAQIQRPVAYIKPMMLSSSEDELDEKDQIQEIKNQSHLVVELHSSSSHTHAQSFSDTGQLMAMKAPLPNSSEMEGMNRIHKAASMNNVLDGDLYEGDQEGISDDYQRRLRRQALQHSALVNHRASSLQNLNTAQTLSVMADFKDDCNIMPQITSKTGHRYGRSYEESDF